LSDLIKETTYSLT